MEEQFSRHIPTSNEIMIESSNSAAVVMLKRSHWPSIRGIISLRQRKESHLIGHVSPQRLLFEPIRQSETCLPRSCYYRLGSVRQFLLWSCPGPEMDYCVAPTRRWLSTGVA